MTNTNHSALSRRGFLGLSFGGTIGLTMGGLTMGGLPSVFAQEAPKAAKLPGFGVAKRVIVLWMNGGPSQLETFDPKAGAANGGPTRAIATAAKGVELAHGLPRLAEQMQDVALIRSMSTREGNHQRARYYLHTGYVPSGTVKHPDLGALICQQKADPELDLPSYINLGGPVPGAGLLGVSYAPFSIQDPTRPPENIAYAKGVDRDRFDRRRQLLSALSKGFKKQRPGPETEGHEAVQAKAVEMMHSKRMAAFDLDSEPAALRAEYGEDKFGQGCLLARRLIEEGVKVVEVQLNGWDTHKDNFGKTDALCATLDAGFATLVKDLRQRDLLSSTLVVCMGEFGRTPRITADEGRGHFARAWSLALAGGPVRGGTVIGGTTPDGMAVTGSPVTAPDLMASIVHAVGLDTGLTNYSKGGRPLGIVDAGGKPVAGLFA